MKEQVIIGLSEEVLSKLDALAAKIGVTVEQVWLWVVKQQYVDAIYYSITASIFIIITTTMMILTKKYWEKIEKESLEGFFVGVNIVVSIITIITISIALTAIPNVFNPEYWALKDLMGMIK